MFTVEIRVNATLVGYVYGQNITPPATDEKRSIYEWEYLQPGQHHKGVVRGVITHDRSQGIAPLVAKILTKLGKEKAK